jgi:hypothetical protein
LRPIALLLFAAIPSLVGCSAVLGLDEGTLGCVGGEPSADGGQSPCFSPDAGAPTKTGASSSSSGGSSSGCSAPAYEDPATHHCYQQISADEWNHLVTACEPTGGYLASITSKSELDLVVQHEGTPVWIGGNIPEASFAWANGEPWSFAPWVLGSPGGPKGNRRCVSLHSMPSGFSLDDCGSKMPGLCERD